MSKPKTLPALTPPVLNEDLVATYLERHPDFLERRPELAETLTPPAYRQEKPVVDFHQFLIKRLQDEVKDLRAEREKLVNHVRSAHSFQTQMHSAALELINARSFEHFVEAISTDLGVHLGLDVISLCMETEDPNPPRTRAGIRFLPADYVDSVFGTDSEDIWVREEVEAERRIYGGMAELVESDVLVRLSISSTTPQALLALGSRNAGHFQTKDSTEPYQFLAGVIEATARAWLDLPE